MRCHDMHVKKLEVNQRGLWAAYENIEVDKLEIL